MKQLWTRYIPEKCVHGITRRSTQSSLKVNYQKNWIVNKVVALKKVPSFHAKFLAGEYKDKVELIVTSCNMTSEHLFSDQLETVMQIECTVETFHSDWLKPLELMAEEEGSMAKFLNMDDIMQEVQNIE